MGGRAQGKGLRPGDDRRNKVILSAIFTTALNDQVTVLHPCKGVKTPPVPVKPRTIITPEQFAQVYKALPGPEHRLLVETEIESGLRWGELTELRVRDIEFASRMLTVSRTVVELHPKFHPDGGRFLVKEYPKDREFRRLKLSAQITAKLGRTSLSTAWAVTTCSSKRRADESRESGSCGSRRPGQLGRTEPNAKGRTVSARNDDRLLTGPVPVRPLPRRLRPLPGAAAGRRQRRPARSDGQWTPTGTCRGTGSGRQSGCRR